MTIQSIQLGSASFVVLPFDAMFLGVTAIATVGDTVIVGPSPNPADDGWLKLVHTGSAADLFISVDSLLIPLKAGQQIYNNGTATVGLLLQKA